MSTPKLEIELSGWPEGISQVAEASKWWEPWAAALPAAVWGLISGLAILWVGSRLLHRWQKELEKRHKTEEKVVNFLADRFAEQAKLMADRAYELVVLKLKISTAGDDTSVETEQLKVEVGELCHKLLDSYSRMQAYAAQLETKRRDLSAELVKASKALLDLKTIDEIQDRKEQQISWMGFYQRISDFEGTASRAYRALLEK